MDIKHALSSTTSVVFSSAATHRSSEWYREEPTSLEFKSRCVAASSRIYVKLTIATIVTLSLKRRVKQLTNAKKPITTSTWRHREEPPIHIKRDIYVWANNNVGLRPLWWSGFLCHRNHQSTWITPVEALNIRAVVILGPKVSGANVKMGLRTGCVLWVPVWVSCSLLQYTLCVKVIGRHHFTVFRLRNFNDTILRYIIQ